MLGEALPGRVHSFNFAGVPIVAFKYLVFQCSANFHCFKLHRSRIALCEQFVVQSLLQLRVQRLIELSQCVDHAFQGRVLVYPAGGKLSIPGIAILDTTITQYTLTLDFGQCSAA